MFSASKTAGPSGYNINNSLRFRSSASAYLSRTPASAGNRKTWTWSAWVKRGALGSSQAMFSAGGAGDYGSTGTAIAINWDTDKLQLAGGNTTPIRVNSVSVYRDPSAWYHVVVAFDTTQATASNRVKLYINNSQITAFDTTPVYPNQNTDWQVNNTVAQAMGTYASVLGNYFDGYMTEINFIDGQQLTPSSFGSTNSTTGVWQPAKYTGAYGTNGFYLPFSDIATTSGSNAGLGKDFSGNGNYFNTNNISVTSGTTYDAMTDSPTLTSATVANYCVLNPLFKDSSVSVSDANMYFTTSANSIRTYSTIGIPTTGKYYWEVTATTALNIIVGIGTGVLGAGNNLGSSTGDIAYNSNANTGSIVRENSNLQTGLGSASNNDIISVALNMDAGTIAFYKNNTQLGSTQSIPTTTNTFFPAFGTFFSGANGHVNFGQRPFAYTPPTGFNRLNTFNLPNSTVVKGNTVMDATLYTGNGTSQTVTNASGFKPDFVWLKSRSSGAEWHILEDTIRGAGTVLFSNSTAADQSYPTSITSFNSNGFSVGSDTTGGWNVNGSTMVGWQWQAGQGSTSSNTSGSITSTVSVNATAGFSIVTYTEPASGTPTIGHGLGVAPAMIIVKARGAATNWNVYHQSLGNTKGLRLNLTDAASTSNAFWNNTSPTSTVFTSALNLNATTVAYCFAEIAGFSKFGSYTGNGSTDGTFVYTGFRPKYVMIKRTDTTNNWVIQDSSRDTYNVCEKDLYADTSGAEATYAAEKTDFLSNGFKQRQTGASMNASGGTYIYMAFAENPFKNALAR